MYQRFFGLERAPFNLTPDPSFLYFSRQHRVAFDSLYYAITERKGFSLLSGEVGTGKTLICRSLMEALAKDNVHTALLFNPYLSTVELLQAIVAELGIPSSAASANKLLETLYAFLLERSKGGGTTIIFLDEAQNFSDEALEAVRMISNFETATEKLVQIVLMGQPEIEKKLKRTELRQLNQRIQVRTELCPLSATETSEYIRKRLEIAGETGRIDFAWRALSKIYRYTRGFPRLINVFCDRLLLAAYVAETFAISTKLVDHTYVDLQGKREIETPSPWRLACR